MPTINFTAINKSYDYKTFSYKRLTVEDCLELASMHVAQGWELLHIELLEDYSTIFLPTEVFDGSSFKQPLLELYQELEMVLSDR